MLDGYIGFLIASMNGNLCDLLQQYSGLIIELKNQKDLNDKQYQYTKNMNLYDQGFVTPIYNNT